MAALLCGLVLVGGAAAAPVAPGAPGAPIAPAVYGGAGAPSGYGPSRAWGGTRIRSLDPTPTPAPTPARAAPARAGGAADALAGAGAKKHPDRVLSNERTFTRWAYVAWIGWAHTAPRDSAPRVARLTWYTEDGFPSVYLLLREHRDAHGVDWVKLRIPGRPNGRTGWVRRTALGSFHLTHLLVVVNRERLRMYLYRYDRRVWSAPVGVGKPSSPTPAGHFWINERFQIQDPSSGYYPYAFGTTDYSTLTDWPGGGVVGIHGPYYDAQGIPGQISHGCIRLEVSDDFWLAAHVALGVPVRVV